MNEGKLIDALYEKMLNELEAYRSWLTALSPDEIIDRGYEFSVRKDIMEVMEIIELTAEQAGALLKSSHPLEDVYQRYQEENNNAINMNYEIMASIANQADEMLRESDKGPALVIEPGKDPYVKEIAFTLKSMQNEVGGYIEACYPFTDPVALICDEEGKLKGKPLNRYLKGPDGKPYDYITGTCIVVGLKGEHFAPLDQQYIEKFSKYFEN